MTIHENFSLRKHNTFGINVCARFFAEVKAVDELFQLLSEQKFKNLKKMVIGAGSNILFTKDFDGLVISQITNKISVKPSFNDSVLVTADAGVIWNDLVLFCINKNFGGIENLSLIPGKVGAAPIQNIGAYGQELQDVFYSLRGIYVDDLKENEFNNSDCLFSYRDSIFKNELKNRFIISDITLKLDKNPILKIDYGSIQEELSKLNKSGLTIKDVSEVICQIRKRKLPDPQKIGNAGSFFKNPEISLIKYNLLKKQYDDLPGYNKLDSDVKLSAAWLIEKCGFKGKRFGNVGVHEKQALVIVNYGNSSPQNIIELRNKIKSEVFLKFDIELHEEVNII